MKIEIFEDNQKLCVAAARLFASLIRLKPDATLGLATGSTPIALYQELIRQYNEEDLDFSHLETYNLDEYVGLAPDHPQSYHCFMNEKLFKHVNLDPEYTHLPDGQSENQEEAAVAYELALQSAPLDMLLLGMGVNGHIGFNEPSDSFIASTHIVTLTQSTIEANKRFFNSADEVPRQAITMGMRAIMGARQIVLLASGSNKAESVRRMVEGPITPQLPASVLQLHPHVHLFLDEAAASLL